MPNNDIGDFINTIPQITRYWFLATIGCSLIGRFGLINLVNVYLDFDATFFSFQIWRLLSCVFFYPITPQTGFHFLINLYFLYSYSSRLENEMFSGKKPDYLFLLIINWALSLVACLYFGIPFIMEALVLSVMYVWCQSNKDVSVQFWFGTNVKAMYLPWVLAGFNFVIRGSAYNEMIGILVGHFYHFFMFQYPLEFGGNQIFKTPQFLINLLPSESTRMSGFSTSGVSQFGERPNQPAAASASYFSNRFPGRGNRLGD